MLRVRSNTRKTFFILGVIAMCTIISYGYLNLVSYGHVMVSSFGREVIEKHEMQFHKQIVDQYFDKRQYWRTSNLGSTIFKNVDSKLFSHRDRENKTYTVLIWRHYDWLERRHVFNYGHSRSNNSLDECSVKNCVFIGDDTAIEYADAVVVHLLKGEIPDVKPRPSQQRWVALSDEAPPHTFQLTKKRPSMSQLANIFNWTMTYRSDSDVPVPYGRTLPLEEPNIVSLQPTRDALKQLVPHWTEKQFDSPIAVLTSNCMKPRMVFYRKLKEHIGIDMYGACSNSHKKSCPGHYQEDCPTMDKYLFYLVHENSQCQQYVTEKSFYHGYGKGAIPIIVGPPKEDCEALLPPQSYIHFDDYGTIEKLASKIQSILKDSSLEQLLSYHVWRIHFKVLNEHGYFGSKSMHYCRICEALNYNDDRVSIYDKQQLRMIFDPNITCKIENKIL